MNHDKVVQQLIAYFPAMAAELAEHAGLLHLQVSRFARHTQAAIDRGDRAEARRCFELARCFFRGGDNDVKNAMCVSYLEHMYFVDGRSKRAWALAEMSPMLRAAYDDVMQYLDGLFANDADEPQQTRKSGEKRRPRHRGSE